MVSWSRQSVLGVEFCEPTLLYENRGVRSTVDIEARPAAGDSLFGQVASSNSTKNC